MCGATALQQQNFKIEYAAAVTIDTGARVTVNDAAVRRVVESAWHNLC
jgi:hypothetical protein